MSKHNTRANKKIAALAMNAVGAAFRNAEPSFMSAASERIDVSLGKTKPSDRTTNMRTTPSSSKARGLADVAYTGCEAAVRRSEPELMATMSHRIDRWLAAH